MANKVVRFSDFSREDFRSVCSYVAAQADLVLTGDMGTARGSGLEARFAFSEWERVLRVEIVKRPWFMSDQGVALKIRDLVERATSENRSAKRRRGCVGATGG